MSNHTPKPIQIPLPIEGETIEIPLNKGHSVVVDAVDADLAQVRWSVFLYPNKPKYATRSKSNKYPYTQMHRIILSRMLQRELSSDEFVDHIDGDGLNNRRSNLRLVTHSQNMHNMKRHDDNKSGFKGVSRIPGVEKKWRVRLMVKGKSTTLGTYHSPFDAAVMYNHFASREYKEYARLNLIPNWEQEVPRILEQVKMYRNNSSGFVGVTPHKNRWRSYICVDGRTKFLGVYDTPEEAYQVRLKALKE